MIEWKTSRTGVDAGTVKVPGAELAYTVQGAGAPLLIVGSSIYYPRTFSQQLRRSATLVCADLAHFVRLGPEFALASISFDAYAECIEAIRVAAGLGEVVVVGHSHHGNVALEYAKRFPDAVARVVLIGSPPVNVAQTVQGAKEYWDRHASGERRALLEQRRRTRLEMSATESLSPAEAYIRQYLADAPLYWADPGYDASWLWAGMAFDLDAIRAFRDLYQDYELTWDAGALDAPVLVVMGQHDYAVPHTLWDRILPGLENVRFHVLCEAGHTPQLEQPGQFDDLLLSWLATSRRDLVRQ